MKKTSETVVFFGSGPVAAKSLAALAKYFDIEAIITKPTTVKEMAQVAESDEIYSVASRRELTELVTSTTFKSRLAVLVDFGIVVDRKVIDYFPLGIVNSHFSLLPEWRGADPIAFAILSGQKKTGVSLMLIAEKLDEGPLLAQGVSEIEPGQDTPGLTEELIELSNRMLEDILPLYIKGGIVAYQQPMDQKPTYSRKLSKDDGLLNWNKTAEQLEREIRAFAGWPKSRAKLAGKDVIITKAHTLPLKGQAGSVEVRHGNIVVFCATGALVIDSLKPAGKKEMAAQAFLAGHKLT